MTLLVWATYTHGVSGQRVDARRGRGGGIGMICQCPSIYMRRTSLYSARINSWVFLISEKPTRRGGMRVPELMQARHKQGSSRVRPFSVPWHRHPYRALANPQGQPHVKSASRLAQHFRRRFEPRTRDSDHQFPRHGSMPPTPPGRSRATQSSTNPPPVSPCIEWISIKRPFR